MFDRWFLAAKAKIDVQIVSLHLHSLTRWPLELLERDEVLRGAKYAYARVQLNFALLSACPVAAAGEGVGLVVWAVLPLFIPR